MPALAEQNRKLGNVCPRTLARKWDTVLIHCEKDRFSNATALRGKSKLFNTLRFNNFFVQTERDAWNTLAMLTALPDSVCARLPPLPSPQSYRDRSSPPLLLNKFKQERTQKLRNWFANSAKQCEHDWEWRERIRKKTRCGLAIFSLNKTWYLKYIRHVDRASWLVPRWTQWYVLPCTHIPSTMSAGDICFPHSPSPPHSSQLKQENRKGFIYSHCTCTPLICLADFLQ